MPTGIYIRTEFHKRRISDAHKGKSSGMKGKHQSEKAKEKIRNFACKNKIWKRFNNLNEGQINKKYSPERNKKVSDAKKSEKNPMWKGNKAKYRAIHTWIRKNKPSQILCSDCNSGKGNWNMTNFKS